MIETGARMPQITIVLFRIGGFLLGAAVDEVEQGLRSGGAAVDAASCPPVDLEELLELPASEQTQGRELLLIRVGAQRFLAAVDSIEGLVTLDRSALRPLPPLIAGERIGKWVWGIALVQAEMAFLVSFAGLAARGGGEG